MVTKAELTQRLLQPLTAEEQALNAQAPKKASALSTVRAMHKEILKARKQGFTWEVIAGRLSTDTLTISAKTLQRYVWQINGEIRRQQERRSMTDDMVLAPGDGPVTAPTLEQAADSGNEKRPMTVADLRAQTAAIEVPAEAL